jgi:4'-phosphopantetheinyl transferase
MTPAFWAETTVFRLKLVFCGQDFDATLCFSQMSLADLAQRLLDHPFLHAHELAYLNRLPQSSPRRHHYLLGRYCAKCAIANHWLTAPPAQQIWIQSGVFRQPVIHVAGKSALQLSISHSADIGVALVFAETYPMGIDLEIGSLQHIQLLQDQLTPKESTNFHSIWVLNHAWAATWLWTVKEALGKALKTGLTVPLSLYEINKTQRKDIYLVTEYTHFSQYQAVSFMWKQALVSIALPRYTQWNIFPFNKNLVSIPLP